LELEPERKGIVPSELVGMPQSMLDQYQYGYEIVGGVSEGKLLNVKVYMKQWTKGKDRP